MGNCLGTDEWTDKYLGTVRRDGHKYCDPNCGRIVSGFLCCIPQKPKDVDVKFQIYRRDRHHTPETLSWEEINERWDYLQNPTKVVIATHGFLERAEPGSWINELKNGWLQRDASHVIIVDWRRGNRINYFQAASNVRVIGMMIGQLILKNNIADRTLAVGFSLGAQIIGEAGKFVKNGGPVATSESVTERPQHESFSNSPVRNSSSNFDYSTTTRYPSYSSTGYQPSDESRGPQNRFSTTRTPWLRGKRQADYNQGRVEPRRQQMIKECHGLDPAGPFFDGCPNEVVLDKSDCELVQIIHTSASGSFRRIIGVLERDFGSWKKAGHCDYWINCGRGPQPQCMVRRFGDFLRGNTGNDTGSIGEQVSCSHGRAPEIYNAQLNSTCNFRSLDCPDCVEDTNCTGYSDQFSRQQGNYFGFMMDSNCSPRDDRNFFVQTTGGSRLCEASPRPDIIRNTNQGSDSNHHQDRGQGQSSNGNQRPNIGGNFDDHNRDVIRQPNINHRNQQTSTTKLPNDRFSTYTPPSRRRPINNDYE